MPQHAGGSPGLGRRTMEVALAAAFLAVAALAVREGLRFGKGWAFDPRCSSAFS